MIYEITPRIWKRSPRVNYRVLFFMVSLAVFFFQLLSAVNVKLSKVFKTFFVFLRTAPRIVGSCGGIVETS